MEHISELKGILNTYLGWNKARIACFANMLLALMATRTVNLKKITCFFVGTTPANSTYRRLQRFFSGFVMDYDKVAGFVFRLFFITGGQWYLTIDRTNWQWGKSDINVLMLAIAFKGTALPVYWIMLDKKGNSDTAERIELVQKFITHFGIQSIKGLLADREFIGKDWFAWLLKEKIPFVIRIKKNTVTTNSRGLEIDINALFYELKPGEQKNLRGKRLIFGHLLYVEGLRLSDGELLLVASESEHEDMIKIYGIRWEIETLFGCFKGRGFHFEDTHITDKERIKKMLVLLTIAFCWAHKTGEWQHEEVQAIKLKKHGRPAVSLFRYGLDYVVSALAQLIICPSKFQDCLARLRFTPNQQCMAGDCP